MAHFFKEHFFGGGGGEGGGFGGGFGGEEEKEIDNKKEMDSGSKDAAADFKKGKKRDIKDKSEIYKSNYGKTYQDLEDEELEDMND